MRFCLEPERGVTCRSEDETGPVARGQRPTSDARRQQHDGREVPRRRGGKWRANAETSAIRGAVTPELRDKRRDWMPRIAVKRGAVRDQPTETETKEDGAAESCEALGATGTDGDGATYVGLHDHTRISVAPSEELPKHIQNEVLTSAGRD